MHGQTIIGNRSRLVRDVWIEIYRVLIHSGRMPPSRLVRDVWIEIEDYEDVAETPTSRLVRDVWIEISLGIKSLDKF